MADPNQAAEEVAIDAGLSARPVSVASLSNTVKTAIGFAFASIVGLSATVATLQTQVNGIGASNVDASKLVIGTLSGARLPTPSSSVLGGIYASTAPAHQFQIGNASGVPTFAQPAATDVNYATQFGLSRYLSSKLGDFAVNLRDVPGFDPTGTADSTTAVQAALNAVPATGGAAEVPCGSRLTITSTLHLHNLTATSESTRNGTVLRGSCPTPTSWAFSGGLPAAPTNAVNLVWAGPAGQPMIEVDGGDGWGLSNLVLDCQNSASDAVKVVSAVDGKSDHIAGLNCTHAVINSTTVAATPALGGKADALRNEYKWVYALLPPSGAGVIFDGVDQAGAYASDTDFNLVEHLQCQDRTTSGPGSVCVIFRNSDSNVVRIQADTFGNPNSASIKYDSTGAGNPILPGSNLSDFVDPGPNATPFLVSEPAQVLTTASATVSNSTSVPIASTTGIAVGNTFSANLYNDGSITVSAISGSTLTLSKAVTLSSGQSVGFTNPLQAFNFIHHLLHVNGGDVRLHLHPKIFFDDGSCSTGNLFFQCQSIGLQANGSLSANVYLANGVPFFYNNGPGMYWNFASAPGYFEMDMAPVNGNGPNATANLFAFMRFYAPNGSGVGFIDILQSIHTPTIRTNVYTFATLPACSAGVESTRAYITDASSPTPYAAVSGGGTTHIPVFCNGSTWVAD